MNSNQRSQGNNQTDNGANEQAVSSSRGGTIERDNLDQSQRSGTLSGDTQVQGGSRSVQHGGGMMGQSGTQPGLDNATQGGIEAGSQGNAQSAPKGEQRNGMLGQQSGTQSGQRDDSQSMPQSDSLLGQQTGGRGAQQSTDRTGSQTGSGQYQDALPKSHESNDVAGGMPRSPGGNRQSADEKMDDDTGLSNTANRQAPIDEGSRQTQQSNVGRRDDMTPD